MKLYRQIEKEFEDFSYRRKRETTMTRTSTEQPEAQRLLDWFEESGGFEQGTRAPHKWVLQAEQELRRQYAYISELEEMMCREVQHNAEPMATGGVEPIPKHVEEGSDDDQLSLFPTESNTYRCQAPQGYVPPQEPDTFDGHDYEGFIGGCQRMGCKAPETTTGHQLNDEAKTTTEEKMRSEMYFTGQSNSLEPLANYNNYEDLVELGNKFNDIGVPTVIDAIAKCEEAGLCCGQLAHIFLNKETY